MSLFGNLSKKGLEESQDRVGGFGPVETDYYAAVIKQAYVTTAQSGARAVNFEFTLPGGKPLRNTVYVTDKAGKNYFLNKDDNTKKVPLPGFTVVDDICLCTVEKDLAEVDIEEKVVKIYDYEQKKELPTTVPVLVELLGKTVGLGVLKITENKSKKNEGSGEYELIAETREINEIDKVFHDESGFTVVEVRAGLETPTFRDGWIERNKGKTRDKRKLKDGQTGAPSSSGKAAPVAAASGGERKSLFGKK